MITITIKKWSAWVSLTIITMLLSGCDAGLESIHRQVVSDTLDEYKLALKGGDPIEICVQAGLVVAGYRQANDEANYLKWKKIEKSKCSQAGLNF